MVSSTEHELIKARLQAEQNFSTNLARQYDELHGKYTVALAKLAVYEPPEETQPGVDESGVEVRVEKAETPETPETPETENKSGSVTKFKPKSKKETESDGN